MIKGRSSNNSLSELTAFVRLILLVCVFLFGCNEKSTETPGAQIEPTSVEINGFQVPVFATAEEQLNYTRSWFAGIQEKRAALEAFVGLYPQEKRYSGLAALDLAYLQLGSDYRFAHEYAGFEAIKSYRAILASHSDFPGIMAKAHWYIGWIYADLLQDKIKGIEEYLKIVRQYPGESVTLLPPVPWVSIIYPSDNNVNSTLPNKPINKWAALALVEIIRHTDNETIAWDGFIELWNGYRDNVVAGFGMRLMLQKRIHMDETLKMAKEYMEQEFSNVHILADIQKEINEISNGGNGVLR